MQKAVGYIRESTYDGDEMSPAVQKEKIELQARLKGLALIRFYEDLGISGSTDQRPDFQSMMKPEVLKEINYILVYRLDRFSRSVTDFHNYLSLLEKYNVELISISENLDTSSVAGRLLRNILIAFAQYEREVIAERVTDGMYKHAQQGFWNGGKVPFGYNAVKHGEYTVLEPNEDAYKVIDMFKIAAEGHGGTVISQKYNLHPNSVRYILRNPIYIGKYNYGGGIYEAKHEGIIDEELFKKVQIVLGKRSELAPRTADSRHLLSGLLKCPHCNKSLTVRYTGSKKAIRRYVCPNRYNTKNQCATKIIDADSIEDRVAKEILNIANRPDVFERIRALANNDQSDFAELEAERQVLAKQLKDVQKAMKDMFALYRAGKITVEQLDMMNSDYLAEEKTLKTRLSEIEALVNINNCTNSDIVALEQLALDLQQNWTCFTDEEKRQNIRLIIKQLTVFEEHIIIEPYNLVLMPANNNKTTMIF